MPPRHYRLRLAGSLSWLEELSANFAVHSYAIAPGNPAPRTRGLLGSSPPWCRPEAFLCGSIEMVSPALRQLAGRALGAPRHEVLDGDRHEMKTRIEQAPESLVFVGRRWRARARAFTCGSKAPAHCFQKFSGTPLSDTRCIRKHRAAIHYLHFQRSLRRVPNPLPARLRRCGGKKISVRQSHRNTRGTPPQVCKSQGTCSSRHDWRHLEERQRRVERRPPRARARRRRKRPEVISPHATRRGGDTKPPGAA